jgi:hypothetical protein
MCDDIDNDCSGTDLCPAAYFNFNTGHGSTLHDLTPNNYDGIIYRAEWTSSFDGDSLSFDGIDDYVDLGDVLDPGDKPWSVCLWFNFNGTSDRGYIVFNKEDLYESQVSLNDDEKSYFRYAWKPHWYWDAGNSYNLFKERWYHSCITYDKNKQRLYKNGLLVYSRGQTGNIGSNSEPFYIGRRSKRHDYAYFRGRIDEFIVWDKALSDAEVTEQYNHVKP